MYFDTNLMKFHKLILFLNKTPSYLTLDGLKDIKLTYSARNLNRLEIHQNHNTPWSKTSSDPYPGKQLTESGSLEISRRPMPTKIKPKSVWSPAAEAKVGREKSKVKKRRKAKPRESEAYIHAGTNKAPNTFGTGYLGTARPNEA